MFRSTKPAALKASAVRMNGLRSIHNLSRPRILSQSSSKRLTTRRPLALVGGERAWSQQRHYAVSAEETSKGVVRTNWSRDWLGEPLLTVGLSLRTPMTLSSRAALQITSMRCTLRGKRTPRASTSHGARISITWRMVACPSLSLIHI